MAGGRDGDSGRGPGSPDKNAVGTATPIKHLVVIFGENISFDHYFATYPFADNPPKEPKFHAAPFTPAVNGLSDALLTHNPNFVNPANADGAANPFRLDRSQNLTADQDHDYLPEQLAFDHGLMDLFPASVGVGGPPPNAPPSEVETTALTMGYYDGNTVTALWNYAQAFAMNDNSYGTNFGPSTVGALNLVSGQTNGVSATLNGTGDEADGGNGSLTVIGDPDPIGDVCSSTTSNEVTMAGQNIGNLLSAAHVTWGWFNGGFDLTVTNPNMTTGCKRNTTSPITGQTKADYSPHHQPFQYYPSTANPKHTRPSSVGMIGHDGDAANHQYDINDFYAAVKSHNFPAVSFLKAPAFEDAHAGYSRPLDEQEFVVGVINVLQQQPEWISTAVVLAYDDPMAGTTIRWARSEPVDHGRRRAHRTRACGNGATALPGRPGYAARPGRWLRSAASFLVVSPWARRNFVAHNVTDQS
jgi:phospholipase C